MRIKLALILGLSGFLAGGSCLPLIDNTAREPDAGTTLAIDIVAGGQAQTVAQGTEVSISWTAANMTGLAATVSFRVESRADLSVTTVEEGIAVEGTGDSGTMTWDTSGYAGPYSLIARVATAEGNAEDISDGLITVDAPPTFEFTAPSATSTPYQSGDTLTIAWVGGDDGASADIGLDTDTDHTNGNETTILSRELPNPAAADTVAWTGNDTDGTAVAAGTYNLFAIVDDGVNERLIVEGSGNIILADADPDPEFAEVTEPAEDDDFLDADVAGGFDIEYQVNESEDVLVEVGIDSDDDHSNGNEISLRAQQFLEADSDPVVFSWDGDDVNGDAVGDGIYNVYIVVSRDGQSAPQNYEAEGRIRRRTDLTMPLIALLQPTSIQTVNPGDRISIEWRDEAADPEPDDGAFITLTIDDDMVPNQGEAGAVGDIAEIEILTDWADDGDDIQDTFSYSIPGTLDPGTYYIFAYIDGDRDGTPEQWSVGPVPFIVDDPAAQ